MSEGKKIQKLTLGNPVVPLPYVPSQVRMSMVPEPPPPIPKKESEIKGEEQLELFPVPESPPELEVEDKIDESPKGTIKISIFINSPYEVEFTGFIAGHEIDMAWRAMMKQYRTWKHTMFKKQEEEKKGESDV